MGSLRELRLKWRITLAVFLASTLVAGVVLALAIWSASTYARSSAREIAIRTAQENAATISGIMQKALTTAEGLASAVIGIKTAGSPSRPELEKVLETLVARNPDLLGAWMVWEPDALDGRDKDFARTPGHDATGRFVPYWNFMDGTLKRETVVDYEDETASAYYFIPLRTRQSAVSDPYLYPVRGKDVVMSSFSVPLVMNDKTLGVVGVDIMIDRLQEHVAAIAPYGTGYAALISNNLSYVAHPNAAQLLKPLIADADVEAVKSAVKRGELYWVIEKSTRLGGDAIKVYAPIKAGAAATPWSLEVVAPLDKVMEPVKTLALNAILLAALAVLGSTFVAYGIGRSIARPITRTAEGITALAEGDTLHEFEDLGCKNEIGALARASDRLREAMIDSIRLSNIVKTMPGAIYEIHTPSFESRGTVVYLSGEISAKTGYAVEDLKRDNRILKPFSQHMRERLVAVKSAADGDGRFESTWDFIRKDGSRGSFLERGTVARLPDGNYQIAGLLLDYTAAREAEEALKASRAQLQDVVTALDRAGEAISIAYPFQEIVYANRSFAQMFGSGDPADVVGRRMADLIQRDEAIFAVISDALKGAMATGQSFSTDTTVVLKKDFSSRVLSWTISPLADGRMLNVTRDITERRNQEQREEQLKTQLAEAQKMESIGRLAGGVAHDFNNILGAVRTFASLIADDSAEASTSQKFANRIISTCDRAADIVRQILLFARASQSELEPLRVRDVIEEVKGYLQASMPARIPLKVQLPPPETVIMGNA
ncbi:MAG: PAS domain S-box protein, partial [Rhodospirillaceae bacterium]|nr:PAS domain S-box protein [Rhodospirillaceae bacterium]